MTFVLRNYKRKEQDFILSSHCDSRIVRWKISITVSVFFSLENFLLNETSCNFVFPVLPVMDHLKPFQVCTYLHGIFIWLQNKEAQTTDVHMRWNVGFVLQFTIAMPSNFIQSTILVTFLWQFPLAVIHIQSRNLYIWIWFFWKVSLMFAFRKDWHIRQSLNKQ